MESNALSEVLKATEAVLFDFDGPICDVFAGSPASDLARRLAETLAQHSATVGSKARDTDDPMEVLRIAPEAGRAGLRAIEEELTKAEVEAVRLAGPPIPGAVASLRAAGLSGRKVAIVSNNSTACVRTFLLLHGLQDLVKAIVGRAPCRPDAMKPDPHSLLMASSALKVHPRGCTLIGDSVTDMEAAQATGGRSIGFANKPGKEFALSNAGADAVVISMTAVAEMLGSL
ncbi:HAD family hydrolase [Streptomyces globisporus]|uniref:HAD family hydrolase n=1 Tax=Streptomyces globisporus TaxID=1908 RepID=UPI00379B9CEB